MKKKLLAVMALLCAFTFSSCLNNNGVSTAKSLDELNSVVSKNGEKFEQSDWQEACDKAIELIEGKVNELMEKNGEDFMNESEELLSDIENFGEDVDDEWDMDKKMTKKFTERIEKTLKKVEKKYQKEKKEQEKKEAKELQEQLQNQLELMNNLDMSNTDTDD